MNFIIVCGSPTGVELAGALAELAYVTLRDDFRNIDTSHATVTLLELGYRVLPPYPRTLSEKGQRALDKLCATILTGAGVTHVGANSVSYRINDKDHLIPTHTVLWAAECRPLPWVTCLPEKLEWN